MPRLAGVEPVTIFKNEAIMLSTNCLHLIPGLKALCS